MKRTISVLMNTYLFNQLVQVQRNSMPPDTPEYARRILLPAGGLCISLSDA